MSEGWFQARITLTDIQRIRVISYIQQIFPSADLHDHDM